MNKISTYEELLAERHRLEAQLVEDRAVIAAEANAIREKLAPVFSVISFLEIFQRKPNQSLLSFGADVGLDLLLRQKLLKRSNWLTRLVVPWLAKGATGRILDKVTSKPKPQATEVVD